jgi:hypothetical protein
LSPGGGGRGAAPIVVPRGTFLIWPARTCYEKRRLFYAACDDSVLARKCPILNPILIPRFRQLFAHVALQAASLLAVKLGHYHAHRGAPAALQALLDFAGAG